MEVWSSSVFSLAFAFMDKSNYFIRATVKCDNDYLASRFSILL